MLVKLFYSYIIVLFHVLYFFSISHLFVLQIYHEVTLVNLLETLLYHQESVASVDEVCLDLLDYCYRKLVNVTKTIKKNNTKQSSRLSSLGVSN